MEFQSKSCLHLFSFMHIDIKQLALL
jgi:hypothetical protein